jgi:hypothetical protein
MVDWSCGSSVSILFLATGRPGFQRKQEPSRRSERMWKLSTVLLVPVSLRRSLDSVVNTSQSSACFHGPFPLGRSYYPDRITSKFKTKTATAAVVVVKQEVSLPLNFDHCRRKQLDNCWIAELISSPQFGKRIRRRPRQVSIRTVSTLDCRRSLHLRRRKEKRERDNDDDDD